MNIVLIPVLLCVFLFFAYLLLKNFLLGWYAYLAVSAFGVALGLSQASIGGINLDPADIVILALLVAGVFRFTQQRHLPGNVKLICLMFLAVFAFSLVRGIAANGLFPACNESRQFASQLAAMLFFITIPPDEETAEKVVRSYIYYGLVLVGIAVLHYAGLNVGLSADLSENAEKNRALPADAAVAIAQALFFSLAWVSHRKSKLWVRWTPVLLASMAVALQHRTIWNVLLAGLAALFFIDVKMLKRLAPIAIVLAILIPLLLIGVYGSKEQAEFEVEDSVNNTGTWDWRVNAWTSLVFDPDQTPFTVLFGKPMGSPILQYQPGGYIEAPPHDHYVYLYIRTGLVGLSIMLAFILSSMKRLFGLSRRHKLALFPTSSAWFLIHLSVLVYAVTYSFEATGIMLVGMAHGLLLGYNTGEVEEEPTPVFEDAGTPGYSGLLDGSFRASSSAAIEKA